MCAVHVFNLWRLEQGFRSLGLELQALVSYVMLVLGWELEYPLKEGTVAPRHLEIGGQLKALTVLGCFSLLWTSLQTPPMSFLKAFFFLFLITCICFCFSLCK